MSDGSQTGDQPELIVASGFTMHGLASLGPIYEEISPDLNQGSLVGELVSSADRTNLGIAITNLGADVPGVWEYKLAGSSDWISIPNLDAASKEAFLLKGTDSIRFSPAANANGQTSFSLQPGMGRIIIHQELKSRLVLQVLALLLVKTMRL